MRNQDTAVDPSFSLINRIARMVWNLISLLFFRYSPVPFHEWRSFLLRLFGAKVGKGVHVYPGVKIWAPWNLVLKDHCGVGSGASLYSQDKIVIGCRAVISQGAYICTGTHNYTKQGFPLTTKPIVIEDQVWIAADAFIHPGVTLYEGCVIGARSVVTNDMPAWMICAGHPCQPVKKRILEEKRETQTKLNTDIMINT